MEMATVLKMTPNKPVTMQEAFYALSVAQEAIKTAMPEAGAVTIRLEPSGAMKVEITVGGLPSVGVENQQKIVFKIENQMVRGYRLLNPTVGFEHGRAGHRIVTCLLDPAYVG
ncbi:MAG: hypothetical protein DI537_41490 [Stutzerimonas stutzeri]|nr:MAG: hypothetical protein DI537_41490 [Stutzerimonas stutzeri]